VWSSAEVFGRHQDENWTKCAALILKAGVQEKCEGIELPDGEVMHEVEDGYKYLGVLQGADIMRR